MTKLLNTTISSRVMKILGVILTVFLASVGLTAIAMLPGTPSIATVEAHTTCGQQCTKAGFSARGCAYHDSSTASSCFVPPRRTPLFQEWAAENPDMLTHVNPGNHYGVREGQNMSGNGQENQFCALLNACLEGGHNTVPTDLADCAQKCRIDSGGTGYCAIGNGAPFLSGCYELCYECFE